MIAGSRLTGCGNMQLASKTQNCPTLPVAFPRATRIGEPILPKRCFSVLALHVLGHHHRSSMAAQYGHLDRLIRISPPFSCSFLGPSFSNPLPPIIADPWVAGRLPLIVAQAQKIKGNRKEQEVFLGVKGNAQLLGMKGADQETNIWKIRLQLMKPVTWIPLIWGVLCGAAASGNFEWTPRDVGLSLLCMTMSGPLLTGYTQTINDWYDREIDAINEPYRPIPSGAISESQVVTQILVLLAGGIGVAYLLDTLVGHETPTLTALAAFGSFISYIYSAPPLKLKQSGWIGNYALGSSYITLPWLAGQALFGELSLDVVVLTMLYSIAGLGIAIVNDFKSIEGDRALGLQSLPVAFGVDTAKWICVGSIDATQLGIAAYLAFGLHEPVYGAVLLALVMPQVFAQIKYFLPDPVANDVKYQASAQPFLVFGLLTTGLAIGHHNAGALVDAAASLAQ